MKKITSAVITFLTIGLLFSSAKPAQAANFFEGFFPPLTFKQPGDPQRPGLWFINDGDFHDGSYQYYSHCGDSSCIRSKREGVLDWYLSATMFPDNTPGNYVNMEASELQTGYVYGDGLENTHPTPGHPVNLIAKLRCSGCNLDGSGGQVGSWGLWQWNSYPEANPDGSFTLHPITSLGFGWGQQGGIFPAGLTMNIFRDSLPILLQPVVSPGLNLQEWHTYRVKWSQNIAGIESVTFYIDGNIVGSSIIPGGMPALSETFWHDNQLPTGFDEFGNLIVTFMNPSVPQSVDVDFISVTE
jgi:hypothetical protein